jgi:hypothetical protein
MNIKPEGTPIFVQFDAYHAGKGVYPSKPDWAAFARQTERVMTPPPAKPVAKPVDTAKPQSSLFDDAWLICGA